MPREELPEVDATALKILQDLASRTPPVAIRLTHIPRDTAYAIHARLSLLLERWSRQMKLPPSARLSFTISDDKNGATATLIATAWGKRARDNALLARRAT